MLAKDLSKIVHFLIAGVGKGSKNEDKDNTKDYRRKSYAFDRKSLFQTVISPTRWYGSYVFSPLFYAEIISESSVTVAIPTPFSTRKVTTPTPRSILMKSTPLNNMIPPVQPMMPKNMA